MEVTFFFKKKSLNLGSYGETITDIKRLKYNNKFTCDFETNNNKKKNSKAYYIRCIIALLVIQEKRIIY